MSFLFQNRPQRNVQTTSVSPMHPCVRPEQVMTTLRSYATMNTQQPGPMPEYQVDPYRLLEDDLKDVYSYIKTVSFA